MEYRAHGKLLLSAEYAVLLGASALALPTSYGQTLVEESIGKPGMEWISYDHEDQPWFKAVFDAKMNILSTSDTSKCLYLQNLIIKARAAGKAQDLSGIRLSTRLEFPSDWGLGSSSTLVHLVAQWAQADPMELFFETSTGSGYDVACAGTEKPIIYRLENGKGQWESTELPAVFGQAHFIHLNQKQRSAPEVKRFLHSSTYNSEALTKQISRITEAFLKAGTEGELADLMQQHEDIMSPALELKPVKELLFPDFDGAIKSLGAWGGDFIMALGSQTRKYFQQKGYSTILKLEQLAAS